MPYPLFLDVPESSDPAYRIIPIPYDGTSTYRKGADTGPLALLAASHQVELYDIETDTEPYLAGLCTSEFDFDFSSPEAMVDSVRRYGNELWNADEFPLFLGGEHSISAGIIESAGQYFSDLTVVQFDAHADLRDEYQGSRYNHACVMARALDVASIFQVGIRSMDASEKIRMDPERVVFAHEMNRNTAWIDRMLESLEGPIYLTIDLDALDPSIMSATGTPEPGGLSWYQLTEALRAIFRQCRVIGADIVELCPDGNSAPEFIAAKLAYKVISYHYKWGSRYE